MEPGLFSPVSSEAMSRNWNKSLGGWCLSMLLVSWEAIPSSKVHVYHLKSLRQFSKCLRGDAGCFVGTWECGGRVGG